MGRWDFATAASAGGRFIVQATKLTQGGRCVDVTMFRGAPTQIPQFSSGDPFGDSIAVLTFPAITIFDDLAAADLSPWLDYYSDVDIYWAPAIVGGDNYPDDEQVLDPVSNQPGLVAPLRVRDASGVPGALNAVKIWEGFVASMDYSDDGTLQLQCQGALFQVDRYLAKPFYPARPWPLEKLIAAQFDRATRPHLRTAALGIAWPAGWARVVPKYDKTSADVYAPVAQPGTKWTGYTSRQTGAWEHSLTGFVQDQLTVMITRPGDGVPVGNQWTIAHHHATATSVGRVPVLTLRDRFAAPDFAVWIGTPGVSASLSGDSTQSENVIYGSGTDIHGVAWRNAVIADDGSRTDYLPLAAARDVYPYQKNPSLVPGGFVSEANTMFGSGFAQSDAIDVAKQSLARDREPGWSGTITLSVDPSPTLTRWQIRAGMVVALNGFLGSGEAGIPFHISAATANPMDGTVELTVDTRFRDLLTVQEALDRTRDPLTPVKMLQVNRMSVVIPDIQAPWDYTAGAGYVPKASKGFHDYCPPDVLFPYEDWSTKHPPLHYPSWYVKVNAGAAKRADRWTGPVPILTSERGDIARTEFACYDQNGKILAIPFHVSIYYKQENATTMPRDSGGPSPYINNAFESIDPSTGQPWPKGNYLQPPDSIIIGWGNRQNGVYNRAGFSPGSEADGDSPTGLLVDGATWHYDNTNSGNKEYNPNPLPGVKQTAAAISLYAMFYAEHFESVYFMGRLFKSNLGVDS